MAQHSVSLSSRAFELLKSQVLKQSGRGRYYSMARIVDYLANFEIIISTEAFKVSMIEDPLERATAWEALVNRALSYEASVIPRGNYKKSNYADLARRLDVRQQLIQRLGIEEPTSEMIDWFIDHGDDDVFRKLVEMKLGMKGLLNEGEGGNPGSP